VTEGAGPTFGATGAGCGAVGAGVAWFELRSSSSRRLAIEAWSEDVGMLTGSITRPEPGFGRGVENGAVGCGSVLVCGAGLGFEGVP